MSCCEDEPAWPVFRREVDEFLEPDRRHGVAGAVRRQTVESAHRDRSCSTC
jgi:hypothetical protein